MVVTDTELTRAGEHTIAGDAAQRADFEDKWLIGGEAGRHS